MTSRTGDICCELPLDAEFREKSLYRRRDLTPGGLERGVDGGVGIGDERKDKREGTHDEIAIATTNSHHDVADQSEDHADLGNGTVVVNWIMEVVT